MGFNDVLIKNINKNLNKLVPENLQNVSAQLAATATKDELLVQKGRIDVFESLPEGATTNDARLEDIKVGANGIEYGSPAEVVRAIASGEAIVPESISIDKMDFVERSINKFNKDTVEVGYINSVTGAVNSGATTYVCSDFILVKPNTAYKKKETSTHAWYDAKKRYISGGSNLTSLVSPSNAMYVRISMLTDTKKRNMLVEGDTLPSIYVPYYEGLKYKNKKDLLYNDIPGTKQEIVYLTSGLYTGNVSYVYHKDSVTDVIIRSDYFAYTSTTITETRTIAETLQTLIYVYHLDTGITEVM